MKHDFNFHSSSAHLIRCVAQRVDETLSSNCKAITARQASVLLALQDAQTDGTICSQTDLVETTGIDRSTLADMLNRMERDGLIRRKRNRDDARENDVSLTRRGAKLASDAREMARVANEELMQKIPVRDRAAFTRALEAIGAAQ